MLKKIIGKRVLFLILLLLILALAIFFRFWRLEQIPPGLYPDVAINGNDALTALKTHNFKLFYPENNGREGLFINLIALSFWLFGVSIWAIKVVPAAIGTLTVLGLYLLTKQLFVYLARQKAEFIALAATFFITISFWHVNFSRIGFRAIMVPFFLVWSFYFLFKALSIMRTCENYANNANCEQDLNGSAMRLPGTLNFASGQGSFAEGKRERAKLRESDLSRWDKSDASRKRLPSQWAIICFILAGLFFGLGFYSYIAYRVALLILVPILIFATIAYWPRFKKLLAQHLPTKTLLKRIYLTDGWWRWDIFFTTLIIVALPLALYFMYHPQDFIGRAGQVSILSSTNPIKELVISTAKTLGMFNVRGDCNWRHNYVYPEGSSLSFGACQPELLWPVGLLFLVGFFWSVTEVLRPSNYKTKKWPTLTAFWTLIFWFFVMLLPAILSSEGLPHAIRSIGAIPPVFIFAALGLFLIFDILKNRCAKNNAALVTFYLMLFVLLSFIAYAEFNKYFFDWSQRKEVKDEFTQRLLDQGNYLNSLPEDIVKYVMVNESGVPVPYPGGVPMPAQTIMFITYGKPNIKYLLPIQNSQILLTTQPAILMPLRYDGNLFAELQKKIPSGNVEEIQKEFSVFKIGF